MILIYLDCWRHVFFLFFLEIGLFLTLVQRKVSEAIEEVFKDHLSGEYVFGEPDHAASGNSGQGGILQILHLE